MAKWMRYKLTTSTMAYDCACCAGVLKRDHYCITVYAAERGAYRVPIMERLCLDCFEGIGNENDSKIKRYDEYIRNKQTFKEKWSKSDTLVIIDDIITESDRTSNVLSKLEIEE